MSQSKPHTIEVTEEEKALFTQWLADRRKELLSQLETVKTLLDKVGKVGNGAAPTTENPKWAAKCLKVLKHHKRKMDSTEVVDYLMETDPLSASLPRVEVMRGVSSRLNQLAKRGQAKKEEINGKMYYTYIKD